MTASDEDPLIKALPPATDYLTYLTIVEYNLTAEKLPTLHSVLQDTTLTTNIGWDLIHLLLPLLPASEECLRDVARLGNPREVLLKVNESLRELDYDESGEDDTLTEGSSTVQEDHNVSIQENGRQRSSKALEAGSIKAGKEAATDHSSERHSRLPLPELQYDILLEMLAVIQPRMKAKYPSRFLATTLQAVLASYSKAQTHLEDLTSATLKFITTLSGTKRPQLPPRMSSSQIPRTSEKEAAPDPEAQAEPPTADEKALEKRLLQAFLTHILETYMLSLEASDDVPGLAWASRLQEKLHPERTMPGKPTYADRFADQNIYQARSSTLGQFLALGRDLGVDSKEVFATMMNPREGAVGLPGEEDDPPSSVEDISLASLGSLFLFAAGKVANILYNTPAVSSDIHIFPHHAFLLQHYVGSASHSAGTIGSEPPALTDTLLALGLLAVENNNIGEPSDDEQFTQYLQTMSLLSANTPIPSLRYHAHYLTSTVLRSHPSDLARLAFIRDTLEHCPYENLKASAVSWLKGETIEANPPPSSTEIDNPNPSIFATPVALDTLSPVLFPDLTQELVAPSVSESWSLFKQSLSFYLATLNFYYLLLSAKHLHEALDIPALHTNNDIGGSYLHPLRQASARFKQSLNDAELAKEEGSEGAQAGLSDLMLLDDALDRVTKGVAALNQA